MARRRPARGCAGGGEGIPASRSARARVAAGAAAVLLAGGIGAWLAIEAEEELLVRGNAVLGVTAAVVLAIGLVLRFAPVVPVAVALLGAAYVALLGFERETIDTHAPLLAAALLCLAELAYWSLELRGEVTDEPGAYLRRVALLAAQLAGVTTAGVILLAIVEGVEAGGAVIDVLGAVAALGTLALLALAARRVSRG
jgi:hypothetical protein